MSNFEIAPTNLSAEELEAYLEGSRDDSGTLHYVDEIFAAPNSVLLTNVAVPNDPSLYGEASGTTLPVAAYVAYPTSSDNTRPDYAFPYPGVPIGFSRMERPGDMPLLASDAAKYPLVILSHGHMSHGLWDIGRARTFASHGFIVLVLSHGDERFLPLVDIDLPVRALRSLEEKSVLDRLLEASPYGSFVDRNRIAMIGLSFGAVTVLAALGAELDQIAGTVHDPRIYAGIADSPFVGSIVDANDFFQFGPQNVGLAAVQRPLLFIYGTADTVAPPSYLLSALPRLMGTRYVVEFTGQPHVFSTDFQQDRINWELLFLQAYLKDDDAALALLKKAGSVAGLGEDHQQFEYQHP